MIELSEDELTRAVATVQAAAAHIVAGFDREQVPTRVALAICGVVAGRLLDRSDAATRAEFIACLIDAP